MKLVVFSQIQWRCCVLNCWKPFRILACKAHVKWIVWLLLVNLFAYQCREFCWFHRNDSDWGLRMKVSALDIHGGHQNSLWLHANISNDFPSRIILVLHCFVSLKQHYQCLNRAKKADVLNSHPTFFFFFSRENILCQNFKAQQLEISISFHFWFHSFFKKKITLNKIWTFLFKKAKLWAIVYQEMDRFFFSFYFTCQKEFCYL